MKCPVCEVQLEATSYEGVTVRLCPQCRGMLVEADRLRAIERRRERQWSEAELREITSRVAAAGEAARRRCPKCLMFMDRVNASWDTCAFHLDRCEPCKVVWLDAGELELVRARYEKEVDSRTPEDWARIERAAVAEMQLKEDLRAQTDSEVAAMQSAASAVGDGPVGVAAFVAWCALRDVQQGIDEESAARRKSAFIRAGILLLVCVAIFALWYYLTGGRYWWR